jgi:hypothetical protein
LSEVEARLVTEEGEPSSEVYVVNPLPGGHAQILDSRKKKREQFVSDFPTVEAAFDWIRGHVCEACGLLLTDESAGCEEPHFGGDDLSFHAF